ncbi:hypothetical protein ACROYT_G014763 [Oculina patagonica]
MLYSDVVKGDILQSDMKDVKRREKGRKAKLESAISEILPKSCPIDRVASESVSTPKSWVHLYQFEEEDDAVRKAITLSLAEYSAKAGLLAKEKSGHVIEVRSVDIFKL